MKTPERGGRLNNAGREFNIAPRRREKSCRAE